MEIKEIKNIIDLMTRNNLSEFDLEKEGFKIRIKRSGQDTFTVAAPIPLTNQTINAPPPSPNLPVTPSAVSEENRNTKDIVSPMVGTFYRAPSPDSPPYADIGQQVTEDTVVCLIEAMKVMNEIKAEMRGIIVEALVDNNKPVEFGQPLFRIKPV